MTELDAALVRRKLAAIRENLTYLAQIAGLSLDDYRRDRFRRKGAERNRESFLAAGREGVIPRDLAESLAPSAGLRNRLVHEYDEIDDAIVLGAFRTAIDQYGRYVAVVEGYLTSMESR